MRLVTLQALNAARAAGRAAVLITPLDDAPAGSVQQRLWLASELTEEASATGLPAELRAAACAALREDRARSIKQPHGGEIFVQPFNPPARLIVVGAVHIAEALVALAALAGYQVTVVDPRSAFARPARFPQAMLVTEWPRAALSQLRPDDRSSIVTLTHDPKLDDPALLAAIGTPAFYIGALGSRRTHDARLARLREAGGSEAQLQRIHGPAGLSIGARSPAEIAISILAQMTAVLRQGSAGTAA